ncbi:Methionine synthase [Pillotina sp. SPG140]|jgi:5-methyltetrahydrofolate--homocysteine methyltransferase
MLEFIMTTREQLDTCAAHRILILDGAMGSLIQQFRLSEADFRGNEFSTHPVTLRGCNDVLCLTKPDLIQSIHEQYLKAGADIIKTAAFNANAVSLHEYALSDQSYRINNTAAQLAKDVARRFSTAENPRFVAGSVGPTAKSASLSLHDPSERSIYFDDLVTVYTEQIRGLLDGGVDILLFETVTDSLNLKAACCALDSLNHRDIPVMVSATLVGSSGRLLTGQTVEAFCVSILHTKPWSLGLNCSLGPQSLKVFLEQVARSAPCFTSAHPNAGLPNQSGDYDESPQSFAAALESYMADGLLNIAGGCCGTTPEHIAELARRVSHYPPRLPKKSLPALAGLEVLPLEGTFVTIAERSNVAGSKKFRTCIQEKRYTDALKLVREAVKQGTQALDVCMDDALLNAQESMSQFIHLAQADPLIARIPCMVDSSSVEVIETALKLLPGKSLVNSLSLKDGTKLFLQKIEKLQRYGAAFVVLLFDEAGQATTFERKTAIAARVYHLIQQYQIPVEDIIVDPGVMSIATGIPEHNQYAADFIRTCAWIREHCPGMHIIGGISNVSFSFRGNSHVRAALNSVFMQHARQAGLSMAIVNTLESIPYEALEPALRELCEAVVLHGDEQAIESLIAFNQPPKKTADTVSALEPKERLSRAIIEGNNDSLERDLNGVMQNYAQPLDILSDIFMPALGIVSEHFAAGTMFLPHVLRSARVMKEAVTILESAAKKNIQQQNKTTILLATVKGDVHDIGKNIVAVVLSCAGYNIIDLGVMVEAERIIEQAQTEQVFAVGLSGLIRPSLDEMLTVASLMEQNHLNIPLLIGGAATSMAHTAINIAPRYTAPVVYVPDASNAVTVIRSLVSATERPRFLEQLDQRYQHSREQYDHKAARPVLSLEEARNNKIHIDWSQVPITEPRVKEPIILTQYPLEELRAVFDWDFFAQQWETSYDDALFREAQSLLKQPELFDIRGVVRFFPARSHDEYVTVYAHESMGRTEEPEHAIAQFLFPRTLIKRAAPNPCLADFISPHSDWLGMFCLTVESTSRDIVAQSVANTLVEAYSKTIYVRVQHEWWGYGEGGIRPAFGYPLCPNHHDKRIVFELLDVPHTCGISLTETAMMVPASSVCGLYFAYREAYYFAVD